MTTIAYSSQAGDDRQLRIADWFFRAAVVCGILPMALGVGITLAYWVTKRSYWELAGMIMLALGFGIVVMGIAALLIARVVHLRIARARAETPRYRRYGFVLALLMTNIPVAVLCTLVGISLVYTTYVDVINETGLTIDRCEVLDERGIAIVSGPIPAGATFRTKYSGAPAGSLGRVNVQQGAQNALGDGYAGYMRFHVRPGPTIVVENIN